MSYCLLEKQRLNLLVPVISCSAGLSEEAVLEVAATLPHISGIYAGMPIKDFESVMGSAVVAAKEAFIIAEGNAFGDRRGADTVLRGKGQEVLAADESLETVILECANG